VDPSGFRFVIFAVSRKRSNQTQLRAYTRETLLQFYGRRAIPATAAWQRRTSRWINGWKILGVVFNRMATIVGPIGLQLAIGTVPRKRSPEIRANTGLGGISIRGDPRMPRTRKTHSSSSPSSLPCGVLHASHV
jgi:hypothetical protein